MTNTKHTPGPWAVNQITREYNGELSITADDTHISSVTTKKRGVIDDQADANACLIAAAPDLFAFAEYVAKPASGMSNADVQAEYEPNAATLIIKARAAIAKAKGE